MIENTVHTKIGPDGKKYLTGPPSSVLLGRVGTLNNTVTQDALYARYGSRALDTCDFVPFHHDRRIGGVLDAKLLGALNSDDGGKALLTAWA